MMAPNQSRFIAALTVGVAVALGLTGCSPSSSTLAADLAQLKGDPATVCINITGMWGTVTALRTNQPNSTLKGCSDVEHGMKSAPIVVTSPIGSTTQILPASQ